jgi:hypothetical protein
MPGGVRAKVTADTADSSEKSGGASPPKRRRRALRTGPAAAKTLFLDVVATLTAHGVDFKAVPATLEGLAFGPDIAVNGAVKRTLFLSHDNDFLGTVVDSNHPASAVDPNQFFVFAVDPADLPAFVSHKKGPAEGGPFLCDTCVCRITELSCGPRKMVMCQSREEMRQC